ncbi:hypothetical protein ABTE09_21135, partial [Acinetobacter baumannii]
MTDQLLAPSRARPVRDLARPAANPASAIAPELEPIVPARARRKPLVPRGIRKATGALLIFALWW